VRRSALAFLLLLGVAIGSLPAQTPAELWGGLYNLTSPTLINRQATTFQVNSSGFLRTTSIGAFDPAATAIFNAFSPAPSDARKILINSTVVALKAATIWDDCDLLYVTAAEAAQNARINWKSPGAFTLVPTLAPPFVVDRGYTGNGVNSRIDTTWTASTNGVKFVQDSASLWVWSRTESTTTNREIGVNGALGHAASLRTAGNVFSGNLNDGNATTMANATSVGMFGISRPDSATKKYWRSGVQLGVNVVTNSGGVATNPAWMLGVNGNGVASPQFSARQQAMGAWCAALTGEELAFFNIMNTYMLAVGATP